MQLNRILNIQHTSNIRINPNFSVRFSSKNDSFVQSSKDISEVSKKYKGNIEIVFSDIDGTISESNDFMTKSTIDAINRLHSKGVPIVFTTARCYKDTLPIIEQFDHNPDYTIALQGGAIIDKDGNYIKNNAISKETTLKLLDWFDKLKKLDNNLHLVLYFNDQPYCLDDIQFWWKSNTQIKHVKSFDGFLKGNKDLQKALLYKDVKLDNDETKELILSSFDGANLDELSLKVSGGGIYDIQNKSVSKDKAIEQIISILKIAPKNAMAIGDSANDIEMLDFIRKQGGLAVAMGNGSNEVKNHANAITSDVQNDGFSRVIDCLI